MITDVNIKGLKELDAALRAVAKETAEKAVIAGLRAGGKLIAEEARQRAPVYGGTFKMTRSKKTGRIHFVIPGLLKRSISVARQRGDNKRVYIGVFGRRYKLEPANPDDLKRIKLSAFYAHMVEFGSQNNIPHKPFLRPAVDSKRTDALKKCGAEAWKVIERVAKKAKK